MRHTIVEAKKEGKHYKFFFWTKGTISISIYNKIFLIYLNSTNKPSLISYLVFLKNLGEVCSLNEGNELLQKKTLWEKIKNKFKRNK